MVQQQMMIQQQMQENNNLNTMMMPDMNININNNIKYKNNYHTHKDNELDIYYNEDEYICSIPKSIFLKNNGNSSIESMLLSIYANQKKKLYSFPRPHEIIERESPYETLEYLLKRGVKVLHPHIKFFHFGSWQEYPNVRFPNIEDKYFTKISFYKSSGIIGAGGIATLNFVNFEKNSKSKVLQFSKKAPKWRGVCQGLNLFGKCFYIKIVKHLNKK